VAAALDSIGGLLGVEAFPTTTAGYEALLEWLSSLGSVAKVALKGQVPTGPGSTRYLQDAGIAVVEVNRADRQDRRRQGKSDPLDAISAARSAQSGRAAALPKGRDGEVEAIPHASRREALGAARPDLGGQPAPGSAVERSRRPA